MPKHSLRTLTLPVVLMTTLFVGVACGDKQDVQNPEAPGDEAPMSGEEVQIGGGAGTGGTASVGAGNAEGGTDGGTVEDPDPTSPTQLGPVDCQPVCVGLECGSDQCGSVCGTCPPELLCDAGACVTPEVEGDVVVRASRATHRINPEVYGSGYVSEEQFADLGIPLHRFGGNATTRYNFRNNRSNSAQDWYFLNGTGKSEGDPGAVGYFSEQDLFVRRTLAAGAVPLITISTIGWVAKDTGPDKQCSFPREEFPDQRAFWECGADWCAPNCGDGKTPDGENISGEETDPSLTSIAVGTSFAADNVAHLIERFGAAYTDRPHYYQLDNEMALWPYTHRDVHPEQVNYQEVWQKTEAYAPVLRKADPNARIMGYGTWGIMDVADVGKDRDNHDDAFLMEWYLKKLADYERSNGQRLIDCVDLHFYPLLDGQVDENVLNATRPLWDPEFAVTDWQRYVFDSEYIRLFPRIREWISEHYPGTGICLSEYNLYPKSPLAALVQAEALGLFGREGLTMASYWRSSDWPERLGPYLAFKMYLNYDGNGGKFGEQSLSTAVASFGDDIVAYAARREADDAVTLILINRSLTTRTLDIVLQGSSASSAETWSYAVGNTTVDAGPALDMESGRGELLVPGRAMVLVVAQ